jgi:LysR family transcriptional regulator, transcription activator of glutamate synthase operon
LVGVDGAAAGALAFEGEDIATLRGLVGVGLGVAVLPKAPHKQKSVVELTISKPASHRLVGAVWLKRRRLPPAARRFITFLNTSGARVLTEAAITLGLQRSAHTADCRPGR